GFCPRFEGSGSQSAFGPQLLSGRQSALSTRQNRPVSELARAICGARSELSRTALLIGAGVPEVGPGRQGAEGSGEVPRGKGQATRRAQIAMPSETGFPRSRSPPLLRL